MSEGAPAGLRALYGFVYLSFAAAAVLAAQPELMQLYGELTHRYHSGAPAQLAVSACGIAAAFFAAAAGLLLAAKRRVPLGLSALILFCFGVSLTTFMMHPEARSVAGANAKALNAAKRVAEHLRSIAAVTGVVPDDNGLPEERTPYWRTRSDALPWHAERVAHNDLLPKGAEPGWLLIRVPADPDVFAVSVVGIDEAGNPAVLRDDAGALLEFKGGSGPTH